MSNVNILEDADNDLTPTTPVVTGLNSRSSEDPNEILLNDEEIGEDEDEEIGYGWGYDPDGEDTDD